MESVYQIGGNSSVVVSDIGVSRRQIVVCDPLIVSNVGFQVVFFGPNDLLTSFARFLIGDIAVLKTRTQSLIDNGDGKKLEVLGELLKYPQNEPTP